MTAKIRIQLESFDHHILTSSCQKLRNHIRAYNINTCKVTPLPNNKRIYCVLRSPHVNKDSREHFEIRKHKRILDISFARELDVLGLLAEVDLPAGVLYQICLP